MVVKIKGNLLTIGRQGYLGLNEIIYSAKRAFFGKLHPAGAGYPTNAAFEGTVIIPWKEKERKGEVEKQYI